MAPRGADVVTVGGVRWPPLRPGAEEEAAREASGSAPPPLPRPGGLASAEATAVLGGAEARCAEEPAVGGLPAGAPPTGGGATTHPVDAKDADQPCVICCAPMGSEELEHLPCGHAFHGDCVQQWLREQPTCPLCRTRVPGGIEQTPGEEEASEALDDWHVDEDLGAYLVSDGPFRVAVVGRQDGHFRWVASYDDAHVADVIECSRSINPERPRNGSLTIGGHRYFFAGSHRLDDDTCSIFKSTTHPHDAFLAMKGEWFVLALAFGEVTSMGLPEPLQALQAYVRNW